MGLDQYHVLGEIYAKAQARNVEKCMIIEDGGCQGGRNCKLGPCVGILHDDYDGNIGLEGMNGSELTERVIATQDDVDRLWDSVEKAICVMAEESKNEQDAPPL
eukprot:scaffold6_cov190-Alexandrium_tamarense.AAC.28